METCGGQVKATGAGKLQAQCPSHEDRAPSLAVTGIEGQVLVYCHAGCQTVDVIAALGMNMADLYDEPKGAVYRYDNGRTVHRTPTKQFLQAHADKPPELYRLARVRAAVAEGRPVFVVEGEKDVHALEAAGVTATCCPMGAGKWSKVDPSPLYGGKVLIVADQDTIGRKHARAVLDSLAGKADAAIFAPKVGKDAADHIAAGHGIADFIPRRTGAVTVRLADVTPERVDWLWPGRLPLGKIVVLDGDPSVGKSTCGIDWAARVSTGAAWPDGAPNRVGSVLLLSAEDGLADTIRPRLDAAGGDPAKVYALTEVRYHDEGGTLRSRSVTLADLEDIERATRRVRAVLVVVDVLMAFLPGKVDSHRDQDVRSVLAGLAAMAERTHCCVLMLRHLNKSPGGSAMYRGGGSIGIIGAARAGLLAAVDPDDETRRVLAGVKSNLAAMPDALAYRLLDAPEHGCARVEWLGASNHTAGALLSGPRDDAERTERDEAGEWLTGYLIDQGGEAPRKDVIKAARGEGHSERTLQRALGRADVIAERRGYQQGTIWRLAIAPLAPVGTQHTFGGANGQAGVIAEIRGVQPSDNPQSGQSRHGQGDGANAGDETESAADYCPRCGRDYQPDGACSHCDRATA